MRNLEALLVVKDVGERGLSSGNGFAPNDIIGTGVSSVTVSSVIKRT